MRYILKAEEPAGAATRSVHDFDQGDHVPIGVFEPRLAASVSLRLDGPRLQVAVGEVSDDCTQVSHRDRDEAASSAVGVLDDVQPAAVRNTPHDFMVVRDHVGRPSEEAAVPVAGDVELAYRYP